jgi:hypothetical protein
MTDELELPQLLDRPTWFAFNVCLRLESSHDASHDVRVADVVPL